MPAIGMMALSPEHDLVGLPAELVASHDPRAGEMDAYEGVLGEAMEGDARSLRTRELRRGSVANCRFGARGKHAGP